MSSSDSPNRQEKQKEEEDGKNVLISPEESRSISARGKGDNHNNNNNNINTTNTSNTNNHTTTSTISEQIYNRDKKYYKRQPPIDDPATKRAPEGFGIISDLSIPAHSSSSSSWTPPSIITPPSHQKQQQQHWQIPSEDTNNNTSSQQGQNKPKAANKQHTPNKPRFKFWHLSSSPQQQQQATTTNTSTTPTVQQQSRQEPPLSSSSVPMGSSEPVFINTTTTAPTTGVSSLIEKNSRDNNNVYNASVPNQHRNSNNSPPDQHNQRYWTHPAPPPPAAPMTALPQAPVSVPVLAPAAAPIPETMISTTTIPMMTGGKPIAIPNPVPGSISVPAQEQIQATVPIPVPMGIGMPTIHNQPVAQKNNLSASKLTTTTLPLARETNSSNNVPNERKRSSSPTLSEFYEHAKKAKNLPIPLFPPPPPAMIPDNDVTDNGLIPQMHMKQQTIIEHNEIEMKNLQRLLHASDELELLDDDYLQYLKAASALESLAKLSNNFHKQTPLSTDQDLKVEQEENEQLEEIEQQEEEEEDDDFSTDELAFIDRSMEKYFFKHESDLETYYAQLKYKRFAPYIDITGKWKFDKAEKRLRQQEKLPSTREELLKFPIQLRKKYEILEHYNYLNNLFHDHSEGFYDAKTANLTKRIEAVYNEDDVALKELISDLEETRDFELLRLKFSKNFEKNENLRFYYDDVFEIYEVLKDNMLNKLQYLSDFLESQQTHISMEISDTELDKRATNYIESLLDPEQEEEPQTSSPPPPLPPTASSAQLAQSGGSMSIAPSSATEQQLPGASSDSDITSQSAMASGLDQTTPTGGSPTPAPKTTRRSAALNRKKKVKRGRGGSSAINNNTSLSASLQADQSQTSGSILEKLFPLLSPAQFQFFDESIHDIYEKFLTKALTDTSAALFSVDEFLPTAEYLLSHLSSSNGQQLVSTRRSTATETTHSSSMTPLKRLTNLTKSIRDSYGFHGKAVAFSNLTSGPDHTAQLNKVMKQYSAPSGLKEDEVLDDLKNMGRNVQRWVV